MATEKFFVFNESGVLKRLKGRIVRFLDNEDPDNDDKVNIRSSLSVPASAEGLTPANNLSDVSSVSTSRDNLSVPSDDELSSALLTRITGSSFRFSTNDYIEVADSTKLSFVNATEDLPFVLELTILTNDFTDCRFISKFGVSDGTYVWSLYTNSSDKLVFLILQGTNYTFLVSDEAMTHHEGNPIHVLVTYGGAGPNS